ncbi:DUF333 domain-containing protein [Caballeronia sp. BR00000012568055]|uniref:putative hemolysin n=1 Tax=Caballeronia sp. BR00000012568055 TaxID=2918761 RepID=UPI0023FA2B13|nr:DUF333 domain-containing protein [Caballeronia sp. BR00000012568055]
MQHSRLSAGAKTLSSALIVLLTAIYLASCTSYVQQANSTQPIGLANPASVNCVKQGGQLQIVDTAAGQVGVCHFENGKQCEEWALLRGECKADSK